VGALFSYLVLWLFFRHEKTSVKLMKIEKVKTWIPTLLLVAMVVLLALSSFADPDFGYFAGLICLILGVLGFLWFIVDRKEPLRKFLRALDWETALFLLAIFIVVGAMVECGWIDVIASKLSRTMGQSRFLAFGTIVLGSVLISAFVDNVPYIAAMLPVAEKLAEKLTAAPGSTLEDRTLIFFGLLIGSCIGGNITPVGASANIVGLGLLKKHQYQVSFWEFVRVGLPFTISAVVPAALFVWLIWTR